MFSWRNKKKYLSDTHPYLDLWSLSTYHFSYFYTKIYVVGTPQKCLSEVLLMCTHNIHFYGEIRKLSVFFWLKIALYPEL